LDYSFSYILLPKPQNPMINANKRIRDNESKSELTLIYFIK